MTESMMTNCSQCPDTSVAHIMQNITSTKSLHCRQRGVSILTPQYASEMFTQMSQQARIQRGVWKGATDAKYSRCLCAPVRLAGRKKKKKEREEEVQHTVVALMMSNCCVCVEPWSIDKRAKHFYICLFHKSSGADYVLILTQQIV